MINAGGQSNEPPEPDPAGKAGDTGGGEDRSPPPANRIEPFGPAARPRAGAARRTPRLQILAIALIAAFTAAAAAAILWQDGVATEERLLAALHAQADDRVQLVERWLRERRGDAGVVARFPSVIALLRHVNDSGEREAGGRDAVGHLTPILRNVAAQYDYLDLLVFDRRGRLLTSLGGDEALSGALAGFAEAVAQQGRFALTDSSHAGTRRLIAGQPVVEPPETPESRVLGSVVFVIDPGRSLYPLVVRESTPTQSGETMLMRRDGEEALYLSPPRFHAGPAPMRVPLAREDFAARVAIAGEERAGEFVDYRGVPVFAATRWIEDAGWGLVQKIDRSEARADFRRRAWMTGTVAALFFTVFAGLIVSLSWRQRAEAAEAEAAHERALRAAREPFRLLSEHATDIVLFVTPDARIVDANRAAERAYGRSREELRGLPAAELRPPELRTNLLGELAAALEGNVTYETTHCRRDGTRFAVEVSAVAADIEGQRLILALLRDISERKAAEARIQHLRGVIEAVRDVNEMFIRETDRQRVLQQTCDLLRRRRTYELVWIGVPVEEGKRVVPVATAGEADYLRRAVITWDESVTGCGPTGTALHTRRPCLVRSIENDERVSPWRDLALQRGYASSAALPIEHGGVLYGALNVYAKRSDVFDDEEMALLGDLTGDLGYAVHAIEVREQREQALAELRASRELLQSIVDNAGSLIYVKDRDGRFTLVNRKFEQALGRPREEILGRTTHDLLPRPVADLHRANDVEVVERRAPLAAEEANEEPDGTHTYLTVKVPLFDAAGEVYAVGGISTDITARKRQEEALRESEERYRHLSEQLEQRVAQRTAALDAANRNLEAFNYSVSHDLRAPLRHIDGYIRALEEDFADALPPDARHYLSRIGAGARHMRELIEALLRLSRVGRAEVHPQSVDLGALARRSFEELRPPDKPVDLRVSPLPPVTADPALLRQLLDNLIGNALKFARNAAEPLIEVGVRTDGNRPIFFVRDNGVGFDPEDAGKLFGVFQRLHTDREFEGTGIGLSIVKRIVDKHGGSVWAESGGGEGATFFFTLGAEE